MSELAKNIEPANDKYVYLFSELAKAEEIVDGEWDAVRGLLGGKGANLGDMTRLEIPVPPGFTVTTVACNAFLEAGEKFPGSMWEQELQAVQAIEQATGKKFGDSKKPIVSIVSLRCKIFYARYDGHNSKYWT